MKKRKDLKIIISSATLQANEFKDFFDKNNFNEGIFLIFFKKFFKGIFLIFLIFLKKY
jgi:hypothetical protein